MTHTESGGFLGRERWLESRLVPAPVPPEVGQVEDRPKLAANQAAHLALGRIPTNRHVALVEIRFACLNLDAGEDLLLPIVGHSLEVAVTHVSVVLKDAGEVAGRADAALEQTNRSRHRLFRLEGRTDPDAIDALPLRL